MGKDVVGSMVVAVSATAQQFSQDCNKIEHRVDQLQQKVHGGGGHGGGFGEALGIGAGIELMHQGIELAARAFEHFFSIIERNKQLSHLAEEVGSTAEELSGLHYAAGQLGSSAEDVDNGLEKMIAKIGEARGGSEEAQVAFKALGLDVNKLGEESSVKAFEDIADAMSKVANRTDRAALAREIFSKGGVRLLNVLSQTKEAIEGQIEDGKEHGRVLTDVQAEAMIEAGKNIERMKASWEGLENTLTMKVLPALTAVINDITWLIEHGSTFFEKLAVGDAEYALQHRVSTPGGAPRQAPEMHPAESSNSPLQLAKAAEAATKAAEKAQETMMHKGASLMDSLLTPQEKFNRALEDSLKLLEVGALNWDFYQRAVAKAADDLERATENKDKLDKLQATPGVGAAISGTSDAFSAIQSSIRGQQDARNREQEMRAKALEEAKKQTAIQKTIADAFSKNKLVVRGSNL